MEKILVPSWNAVHISLCLLFVVWYSMNRDVSLVGLCHFNRGGGGFIQSVTSPHYSYKGLYKHVWCKEVLKK